MSRALDPDHGTAFEEAAALLREEHAVLRASLGRMTADMTALIEASRDSNADDEHDPEGQTIAFERAQLAAMTDQAREHLKQVEGARSSASRRGRTGSASTAMRPSTRPGCKQDQPHVPASNTHQPGVPPGRNWRAPSRVSNSRLEKPRVTARSSPHAARHDATGSELPSGGQSQGVLR